MFDLWRLLLTLPWRCEEPPDQVQSPNTPATMTPDKVSQCIWPLELLQTQATHHRTLCGQLIQNNNKWFMDQIYQTDQHKNSKTVWKTLTNSLKPSSEKTALQVLWVSNSTQDSIVRRPSDTVLLQAAMWSFLSLHIMSVA